MAADRSGRLGMGIGDIQIRPVTENLLASVLDVYRQREDFLALGPQPVATMAMVRADLSASRVADGRFCGVHGPSGEMLGVVDYVPRNFEGQANQAFIALLMIAAPYRSYGLGAAILMHVEQCACGCGATACQTAVQTCNAGALRFWQRNGYVIVSGAEKQADGTTVYRLHKSLGGRNPGATAESAHHAPT
jgi:GNAT superfamily N-acetyltransferase